MQPICLFVPFAYSVSPHLGVGNWRTPREVLALSIPPSLLVRCFIFFSIARFASKCHFVLGLCNAADADLMFSVLVPAPKHLTLERQLNKSVLIGWTPPDPPGCNQIESYHVYVDGVLKVTVKATERTRALVEGVDSNRVSSTHRVCN